MSNADWTSGDPDQYLNCRRDISPKWRADKGAEGPCAFVLLL